MKTGYIVAAAAVVVGLIAWAGKTVYSASRLLFRISKIGLRLSGATPFLDIDIMVGNTTSTEFTLTAFAVDVYFNGSLIGQAANYNSVEIIKYSETKIVAPVRMSLIGSAATLLAILNGESSIAGKLTVKGTVTANGIPFPINVSSNIV